MEKEVLYLPTMKGGVVALGDLWDCRETSAVGNLFEKPLTKDHLEAHPISTLDYSLRRVKDLHDLVDSFHLSASLNIEAMEGKVQFGGKAAFERDGQKKFHEEMILCNYESSTFAVRLKNVDAISPIVKENLENGTIIATHYVDSVIIGGTAQASIKYSENIDKSHFYIMGELSGKLEMGSVTASAKASLELLDTTYEEDISTFINIRAQPNIPSAPTNCNDMFKAIEGLSKVIEDEKHYPMLAEGPNEKIVYGVPIKFRLMPITRIISTGQEDTYNLIEEELLDSYSKMLITLEQFCNLEHTKSLLREEVPSIVPILFDSEHPITVELDVWSKQLLQKAEDLKLQALKLFADYKYKLADEKDLLKFLEKYDEEFALHEIMQRILDFKIAGRNEMNGVRIKDIGNAKISLFSNLNDMRDWYVGDKIVKMLLQTKSDESTVGVNGTFVQLYDIVPLLANIGVQVGVAFPLISDQFSLTFKTTLKETVLFGEDIPSFIDFLRILLDTGKKSEATTLFHVIHLELAGLKMYPLTPELILEFPLLFSIMKLNIKENMIVCNTHCDLLMQLATSPDTLNIVVTLQAVCDAFEQIQTFKMVYSLLGRIGIKSRWIFSRVNVSEDFLEAPLLFIFQGDVLTSICKDLADVSILVHDLESNNVISSALSIENIRNSPFYTKRINFALKFMPQVILAHLTKYREPLEDLECFIPPEIPVLNEAIEIVGASLKGDIQLFMKVAQLALKTSIELEALFQSFQILGGFISSTQWESMDWTSFYDGLETFTRSGSISLIKITNARDELQDPPKKEEEEDKSNFFDDEDAEDEYNKIMNTFIYKIVSFLKTEKNPALTTLRKEVKRYSTKEWKEKAIDRRCKIVAAFETSISALIKKENSFHLIQLLFLAEKMMDKGGLQEDLLNILSIYVTRVNLLEDDVIDPIWPQPLLQEYKGKIAKCLEEGSIFRLAGTLASLQVHPLLLLVHEELKKIGQTGIPCPVEMKSLLEIISTPENPFSVEQLEAIWLNPSFLYLVRVHLEETTVRKALVQFVRKVSGTEFPYYVPNDVAEKLRPFILLDTIFTDFSWEEEWKDILMFKEQLQKFVARENIPQNFMEILMHNLNTNQSFKLKMIEKKCLFYFDETLNTFSQPWSLENVRNVISLLEENDEKKPTARNITSSKIKHYKVKSEDFIKLQLEWHPFTKDGRLLQTTFPDFIQLSPPSNSTLTTTEYYRLPESLQNIMTLVKSRLSHYDSQITDISSVSDFINYPLKSSTYRNQRITRGDVLAALVHSLNNDPVQLLYYLETLSNLNMAMPLLIKNIFEDIFTIKFRLLEKVWQNVIRNDTYFFSPYKQKFILTLRVGETDFGRSTLLNRHLMRNRFAFSSKNEPQAEFGPSLSRNGFVEFIELREDTVDQDFWNVLMLKHENCTSQLGSLHGDILEIDDALDILTSVAGMVSCFIVFWKADNWNDLRMKNERFNEMIETSPALKACPILHLILYPDMTINNHVNEQNLIHKRDDFINPKDETKVNLNSLKLFNILQSALKHPSPVPLNKKESKNVEMIESIESDASSTLLEFIRFHSIPKINSLIDKQIEDDDKILEILVQLFLNLLEEASTTTGEIKGLHHLRRELELESKLSSKEIRNKIEFLRAQISSNFLQNTPSNTWILEMQQACKYALSNLQLHLLLPHNLIRLAIVNKQDSPAEYIKLLEALSSIINLGFPVELLSNNDRPELTNDPDKVFLLNPALKGIPKDTRIFVVSTLGLKNCGKSTLLNRLFGPGFSEELPTSGVSLRLHWLQEGLRQQLQCDAFILLDVKGVGGSENKVDPLADSLERLFTSWVLSITDTTLVTTLGYEMGELPTILEIALFYQTQFDNDTNASRIMMIQNTLQDQSEDDSKRQEEMISNVFDTVMKNADKGFNQLDKVYSDILAGNFCHKVSPIIDQPEYFSCITFLYQKIFDACSLCKPGRQTLGDWIEKLEKNWEILYSDKRDILEITDIQSLLFRQSLQLSKTEIKDSIANSVLAHLPNISQNFLEQLQTFFDDKYGPGFEENISNLLLSLEEKLYNLVDNCEGNNDNQSKNESSSSSCVDCRSAFAMRESFISKSRGQKQFFLLEEEITNYSTDCKVLLYNRLNQVMLSKQIRERKSEKLKSIVQKLVQENGEDSQAVFTKFISYLSSKLCVIPSHDLFHEEILTLYSPKWNKKFKDIFNHDDFYTVKIDLESLETFRNVDECRINLTKDELTWLKIKVIQTVNKSLLDYTNIQGSLYQPGMASNFKKQLDDRLIILEEKFGRWGASFNPDFKFTLHLYGIQNLSWNLKEKQELWDEINNPVVGILSSYEEFIEDPGNYFFDYK